MCDPCRKKSASTGPNNDACKPERGLLYTETVIKSILTAGPKPPKKTAAPDNKKPKPNSNATARPPSAKSSCKTECKPKCPPKPPFGPRTDVNLGKPQVKKCSSNVGKSCVDNQGMCRVASKTLLLPQSRSLPSTEKNVACKAKPRPQSSKSSQRLTKAKRQVNTTARNCPLEVKLGALHYHASERIRQLSLPKIRFPPVVPKQEVPSVALKTVASPVISALAKSKTAHKLKNRNEIVLLRKTLNFRPAECISVPCLNNIQRPKIPAGASCSRHLISRISRRTPERRPLHEALLGITGRPMDSGQFKSSGSKRILEVPRLVRILEDTECS